VEVKFDKDQHFEERIVQALIIDHEFAEQMMEVLSPEYFNVEHLKEIVSVITNYYKKYSCFPSWGNLGTIIKHELDEGILKDKIIQYLIKIRKEPLNGDMEYVKDSSLEFCKKRRLAVTIDEVLDLIEGPNTSYENIVSKIEKAVLAGSERQIGHIYDEDLDKRMAVIHRSPVPSPWAELNAITQGGPSGGELCTFIAPTCVGKSHARVSIGAAASREG
jgi:replicative DNA helicase